MAIDTCHELSMGFERLVKGKGDAVFAGIEFKGRIPEISLFGLELQI